MKIDNIEFESTAVTVRKTDVGPKIKSLPDVYEANAKLVFLFDRSSSMSERLSANYVDNFLWTPEIMATIKAKAETVYAQTGGDATARFFLLPSERNLWDMVNPLTQKVDLIDDNEIQRRIVQFDMTAGFNVPVNWAKHKEQAPTRIEVVRRIAKKEIERRLDKYPQSNIAVVSFETDPQLDFNDGKREDVFAAIDKLFAAGGTDILLAIKMGLRACEASPSPIGLHHFIIVSDGEDYRASQELGDDNSGWIKTLKASGVLLDYIHIGDRMVNEGIKKACIALGGEFSMVNTEKDLEEKFVDVVQRKCLPPVAEEK